MNQEWFEMHDIRRRRLDTAVWIPLRAVHTIREVGQYGCVGYEEEFFGVGTLAISVDEKDIAGKLGWSDVGIDTPHGAYYQDGRYYPSDVYEDYGDEFTGIPLVLEQHFNSDEHDEWHLHQDYVIALRLKREGDIWVCPNEGYTEAARLIRHEDDAPYLFEVRAEHLKDYLRARNMALYVTSYRSRREVVADASHINWDDNPITETHDADRWEGRISEVHEGGAPFGSSIAVFHAARTDIDSQEDVPIFGLPTEDNVTTDSWTVEAKGKKVFHIQGEFWRNEWVEPGALSPRIIGDESEATVFFITDAEGSREKKETLKIGNRWLWFSPEVIMALSHRRGGALGWYTQNTGHIRCSPNYKVHFGINQVGLVNVYAKDIALLPEWQQRIWAGYNTGPEGGVSEELLASQVKATPAQTKAPEQYLGEGLALLNKQSETVLGFKIIREHDYIPEILEKSHRFRAVDKVGLYALAKDIARLTADSLDAIAIQKFVAPPKGEKWGSLKSLEHMIALKVDPGAARLMLSPLVGVYELRHADAHLPSAEADEALSLVGVDRGEPFVYQGYQLLHACVSSIYSIIDIVRQWNKL